MKRGAPLRRTELRRSPSLLRGSGLAPASPKRAKQNGIRRLVVSAMREAVHGRCARCGRADGPVHGHERLGRAQGGDILQPDCLLCPECNGWCEDNPRVAAWTGWKVSSKWPHDHTLTSSQAWALDGSIVEFQVPEHVGVSEPINVGPERENKDEPPRCVTTSTALTSSSGTSRRGG